MICLWDDISLKEAALAQLMKIIEIDFAELKNESDVPKQIGIFQASIKYLARIVNPLWEVKLITIEKEHCVLFNEDEFDHIRHKILNLKNFLAKVSLSESKKNM